MSNERGFTFVEVIVAMVVIGVAVSGVISVFSQGVRNSSDPIARKQMLVLAQELMEEARLKPYAPQANAAPSACARDTFNDVSDYNGYASTGRVCDIEGTVIPALNGLSVSVGVVQQALAGVADAKRITVSISRGSEAVSLEGWRTDHAGP